MTKSIQTVIKWVLTLGSFAFIVWKIAGFDNPDEALNHISLQFQQPLTWAGLAVLIGWPLHWFFEVWKWRYLINTQVRISFCASWQAVLTGLTMAILTPNRIGELLTRVWVVPKRHQASAIALSGINTLSQLIIVQLGGLIGIIILLQNQTAAGEIFRFVNTELIILASLIAAALLVLYCNPKWFSKGAELIKLNQKYPGIGESFKQLTWANRLIPLALSGLKYGTYTLQFYFLLQFLGANIPFAHAIPSIMTVYILLNYIPMITLGEASIRGSLNLLVLGIFTDAELAIIVASFGVWILNVAIPAIIGAILMKNVKLKSDF